jgi:hypothetical protein
MRTTATAAATAVAFVGRPIVILAVVVALLLTACWVLASDIRTARLVLIIAAIRRGSDPGSSLPRQAEEHSPADSGEPKGRNSL